MVRRRAWIAVFGFLIVVGCGAIIVSKVLFGVNVVDTLLSNGKSCGFAWKDYGVCERGYYCQSSHIIDAPGSCIKVIPNKSFILYESASVYYSGRGVELIVTDNNPVLGKVEWTVEFSKGGQKKKETFQLVEFESKIITIFSEKFKFGGLDDGVDRRRMTVTLL